MTKIVTENADVLREIAKEVQDAEIKTKNVQNVVKNMKEALAGEKHGVAIAAPQIGESLRIFVVAGKVFNIQEDADTEKEDSGEDQIFINPKITKQSKKIIKGDEGCLSVPGKYSWHVDRPEKITLEYLDENGDKQTRGASGFLARIFAHEVDHLNGVLYTDKAKEIHDVDEDFNKVD